MPNSTTTHSTKPAQINSILERWWAQAAQQLELTTGHESLLKDITNAYSETHRFWHTTEHLTSMFTLLETCPDKDITPTLIMAIFYHDYIYNPGSKHNELKSAKAATKALATYGCTEASIKEIYALIIDTQSHDQPLSNTAALLFDLDLAVLGSTHTIYLQYVNGIAKEHSKYPGFIYKTGRKIFLKGMLKKNRLFFTKKFMNQFEQQARKNMTTELRNYKEHIQQTQEKKRISR